MFAIRKRDEKSDFFMENKKSKHKIHKMHEKSIDTINSKLMKVAISISACYIRSINGDSTPKLSWI
jgi:hypothetical protein